MPDVYELLAPDRSLRPMMSTSEWPEPQWRPRFCLELGTGLHSDLSAGFTLSLDVGVGAGGGSGSPSSP
jgi:hypothetical protein